LCHSLPSVPASPFPLDASSSPPSHPLLAEPKVDDGELDQGCKHERRAQAHPDVDGLEQRENEISNFMAFSFLRHNFVSREMLQISRAVFCFSQLFRISGNAARSASQKELKHGLATKREDI
jgi:hypothetical protein